MNPKTSTSADKELREAVARQLDYDCAVPSQNLGVAAANGVVTLSGFVATYADKQAAEQAAKSVYGVKALANDMVVKPPAEVIDPDIAAAAVLALDLDVHVPCDRIKVIVENGWLTLEGQVEAGYQKEAAERAVKCLAGVRGISNSIVVDPKVSVADVRTKIEEALRRSAELDARRLNVEVSGGTVTLSGSARSWAERDAAHHAAWRASGVNHVVNHIEVIP